MLWPLFSRFTSEHDVGYRVTFFLVQLSLICGVIVFLSRTYTSAVWRPQPSRGRGIAISLIILLPLLLVYLSSSVRGIHATIALSGFGVEGTQALASSYQDVLGALGIRFVDGRCFLLLHFVIRGACLGGDRVHWIRAKRDWQAVWFCRSGHRCSGMLRPLPRNSIWLWSASHSALFCWHDLRHDADSKRIALGGSVWALDNQCSDFSPKVGTCDDTLYACLRQSLNLRIGGCHVRKS